MTRISWVIAATLPLLGTPVLANDNGGHHGKGEHHKQSLKMTDLPPAVQETFRREAAGGTVEEVHTEKKKNGQIVYEGEIVRNGKGQEIEVNAAGQVVEREKEHNESKEHEHGKK